MPIANWLLLAERFRTTGSAISHYSDYLTLIIPLWRTHSALHKCSWYGPFQHMPPLYSTAKTNMEYLSNNFRHHAPMMVLRGGELHISIGNWMVNRLTIRCLSVILLTCMQEEFWSLQHRRTEGRGEGNHNYGLRRSRRQRNEGNGAKHTNESSTEQYLCRWLNKNTSWYNSVQAYW